MSNGKPRAMEGEAPAEPESKPSEETWLTGPQRGYPGTPSMTRFMLF